LNVQRFFSASHTFWYRVSGGRFFTKFRGGDVLLLTTTGRKTGKNRTTPVIYVQDGENLGIVASNGGRDRDPAWWTNLQLNPRAQVQVKGSRKMMTAEKAGPEDTARLWSMLTKVYPDYDDYQKKTKRTIPVVILRPSSE
jgi:F420H(2)-dependent quinone reductase